jgi:HSP20 family protein
MTLVRFNPNRIWGGMPKDIDSVFDSFLRTPVIKSTCDCDFMPRVDIVDDKDSVNINVELPGMKKDDIKVTIDENILTIAGERKHESEQKDRNYIRTERLFGSFSRSFTLPDDINSEKIMADYKDGILAVNLAKVEKPEPKEITVEIK